MMLKPLDINPANLRSTVVIDKKSGLCRGFGFVEMAELADVAIAFSLLNNTLLKGHR